MEKMGGSRALGCEIVVRPEDGELFPERRLGWPVARP